MILCGLLIEVEPILVKVELHMLKLKLFLVIDCVFSGLSFDRSKQSFNVQYFSEPFCLFISNELIVASQQFIDLLVQSRFFDLCFLLMKRRLAATAVSLGSFGDGEIKELSNNWII